MTDQVTIVIPRPAFHEGSAFTATAYFRDRATAAASTPTTAKYRVDCLTTGVNLQDWTTLTPAASIPISITATHQAIQNSSNRSEVKQLTVSADHGLAAQARDVMSWTVNNTELV